MISYFFLFDYKILAVTGLIYTKLKRTRFMKMLSKEVLYSFYLFQISRFFICDSFTDDSLVEVI